jgi:hypothetical protein
MQETEEKMKLKKMMFLRGGSKMVTRVQKQTA